MNRIRILTAGVSYASLHWYEAEVRFSHEYKEVIDVYSKRVSEEVDRPAGGQLWSGLPARAAIEAAARQQRAQGSQAAGDTGGDAVEVADGVPSEVTQSTTREAMSTLLHGEVVYISKEGLARVQGLTSAAAQQPLGALRSGDSSLQQSTHPSSERGGAF